MTSEVTTELVGGVLAVTLSRLDKKNALTNGMYGALADAIQRAESDADVRVVLIQADGELFTSGNDLGEFAEQATGKGPAELNVLRFLQNLAVTTIPIVAAVQGKAVGVGTTMLLHCDYVVLSEDAQLSAPFVNLALVPEAGSSYLLPARTGHVRAFQLFSLGESIDAKSAVAWGIANTVVPGEDLRTEARRVAEKLATKPLGSLKATKQLMRDPQRLLAQIDAESLVFAERLKSAEAREAFTAFAQKRQPDFSTIR
ncbi:enoyl-CoA hydratase [Pseudomonas sp. LFM046]|uniref:enoyl-CoA hydratase n=1 Tax=Pseudomonas sp. LFM046 TaxID=1608357 RepID=UPI0005CFB708|nr:enoyl-CoA hydratase [Pseudomonas sp. LFM046]